MLIFARLRAAHAGFDGVFVEAHALDAKIARKVPRRSNRPHVVGSRSPNVARPVS